ncbi:MAG: tetratricopeptide repeat protein [Bacteroides sp.]|nr:tetratricopeptide repeat protein [Bacteroides sp.]
MKRVFILVALFTMATLSYSQEKAVKDARAANTSSDFTKARQLIQEALDNPETQNDPETWNVAGSIEKNYNAKETEKAYLRKPYDTLGVYNSVLDMFKYFLKTDDLAQIPNEKGKIKNKYRKTNAASLVAERPNLINGGIQYFNLNDDKKALEFFGTYIDASSHPIFEKENFMATDTLMSQVAYYASLAAAKTDDYSSILKYAPYAENDKEFGQYAMEFISTAYKAEGDTIKWLESLKAGIQKYPDHPYFFGHLIDYYSNNNKFDEAMTFADDMIAKDPNNTFFLYVKGYLYYNMKEYDKAIEFYNKTIAVDPNYAEAYSNLGLIYCQLAQDYADKATADTNDPNYATDQEKIKKYYEEARPYYEKARELKPDQQDLWIQGLYRVYYNLNMAPQFEEIEKLMGL